jgi:hypothetical protein
MTENSEVGIDNKTSSSVRRETVLTPVRFAHSSRKENQKPDFMLFFATLRLERLKGAGAR